MDNVLLELGLHGGLNRHVSVTRHGHTAHSFALRRPGRVGVYLLGADEPRPRLLWRSTSS